MQAEGGYSEAYFWHGLSVQMAEAMADYVNNRIRCDLGLGREMARRYSWAMPRFLSSPTTSASSSCLAFPEAIGVVLTESYQLGSEQSTAAIVVPHPWLSVYFAVRP